MTAFAWMWAAGGIDLVRTSRANFIIAQCIGFAIQGLFVVAFGTLGPARIDRWRAGQRAGFFALVPLAGAVVGYPAGIFLLRLEDTGLAQVQPVGGALGAFVMIWAVLTFASWRFFRARAQLADAERHTAAARARAAELERQAIDAQLRALRAQVEPHFLFNTLANVLSLVELEPARARRMLTRLIDLLRSSLSASRAQQATIGDELGLVEAYLEIMRIRMGDRLQYAVEVDPGLRPLPLPPLLLQPLVENAIRHGVEPKVEGGQLMVGVAKVDGVLQIVVRDDGVGFGSVTRGGGVGLTNLRQRLVAQFGDRAGFAIEDAQPGTRVRLKLPLPVPAEPHGLRPSCQRDRDADRPDRR